MYCSKIKKSIISPIFYGSRRRYSNIQTRLSREIIYPNIDYSKLEHRLKNWQDLRKNKLTASTFGRAVGFRPNGRLELFREKIGAIEPFTGNAATYWSNIKEKEALESYEVMSGFEVSHPKFQVYGKDWLAASPDGIFDIFIEGYDLPSRGVLEIKCPCYLEDKSKSKRIPWKRVPLHYVPQGKGLMEILDRDWLDMYCWTEYGSSLIRMYRDKEYWNVLEVALNDFWWKHVQPAKELYNRSGVIDPSLIPTPKHERHQEIVCRSKRIVDNSELLIWEIYGNLQN